MSKNYNFNKILVFKVNHSNNKKRSKYYNEQIPIEWQLILMSDGSFTQNLNSLTNEQNKIHILYKLYFTKLYRRNKIRETYMKSYNHNNLIFAESIWQNNKTNLLYLQKNKPIGRSLIESKIDIYKDIQEIYYGYSIYLKEIFQSDKAIWGRKYTLYFNHEPLITIKEFFSPQLIHFFESYQALIL
uniref:Chorismate lyase n=1 Tax=Leiomenia cribrosa TaxID=217483 RepID=A0A4D6WYA6_9FLOR|nr:hypothetical protein [Leiomenia cribrosa]